MGAFLLVVMAVMATVLVGALTFSVATGNWPAAVVPVLVVGALALRDYRRNR